MIESRGLSEDINTRTWLWLDVIGGHASETKKKKGRPKQEQEDYLLSTSVQWYSHGWSVRELNKGNLSKLAEKETFIKDHPVPERY